MGNDKEDGSDRRVWDYPVMMSGEETAVSNRDKADIMTCQVGNGELVAQH